MYHCKYKVYVHTGYWLYFLPVYRVKTISIKCQCDVTHKACMKSLHLCFTIETTQEPKNLTMQKCNTGSLFVTFCIILSFNLSMSVYTGMYVYELLCDGV